MLKDKVVDKLKAILGLQCLGAPLKDKDPSTAEIDPESVVQERYASEGVYSYTAIPRCEPVICDPATAPVDPRVADGGPDCKCATHPGASPTSPCWYITS